MREGAASPETANDERENGSTPSSALAEALLPQEAERFLRFGWLALLVLVGGFFLWATLVPLDAGVTAQGLTIVESKRKTVAHLTGGVVSEILVRDMQLVHAGDTLVTLDATSASSEYEGANKEYWALLSKNARLEAERSEASQVDFPQELIAAAETDAVAERQMALQQDVYQARRSSLESDLEVLSEQQQIFFEDAAAKRKQLELLKDQTAGMRTLAEEGYASKTQRWELERQVLELQARMELAQRQAREAHLRGEQRQKEYRKEVKSQLTETSRQLAVLQEKRRALEDVLSSMVIRAPVDGYVNGLAVHTVGGVVGPGQSLMELIPFDEGLEFEAQIQAHLIEHVRARMPAEVMLQNFVIDLPYPLQAEVISVSADLVLTGNPDIPPHYVARIKLTDDGKRALGPRVLQPGMPVSVLIKTGERTMLQYLLNPLMRRLHQSMTEQ